jgi:hypothetical protein
MWLKPKIIGQFINPLAKANGNKEEKTEMNLAD